jgi:hypothetical protein
MLIIIIIIIITLKCKIFEYTCQSTKCFVLIKYAKH